MSEIRKVSKEDFKEVVLENKLPVLVDFSTDGCGPCELLVPIIKEMQEEMAGRLEFYNHNVEYDDLVNDANDIVKEFDVMGFPTVMIFKDGKVLTSIIGVYDKDDIVEEIEKVL